MAAKASAKETKTVKTEAKGDDKTDEMAKNVETPSKSLYCAESLTDDHKNINLHDFVAIVPGIVYDVLIFGFMCSAINTAPFTKVEESFNTQAVHDLMIYKIEDLAKYDHLEFPGVVPRTFLGPIVLRLMAQPVISIMTADGKKPLDMDWYLYMARYCLALLTVHSLRTVRQGANRAFGYTVGAFFSIICLTQFHLMFWGSRLIPNTWALIFVGYGVSAWIESWKPISVKERMAEVKERERIFGSPPTSLNDGRIRKLKVIQRASKDIPITFSSVKLIGSILFAAVVFRLELLALLVPLLVSEVFIFKHIKLIPAVVTSALFAILSLGATILVDTGMWKKSSLFWPEYEVFKFNIVNGRSKEYGISPPNEYVTSLLPRIAPIAFPLAIYAYGVDHRVRRFLTPAVIFVATMSLIGHKEWRFVFPVIPLINLAAAVAATRFHRLGFMTRKSQPVNTVGKPYFLHKVLAYFILPLAFIGSFLYAHLSTEISSLNYPGGVALNAAHLYIKPTDLEDGWPILHMDAYTCSNGVSRFLEKGRKEGWIYRKDENLTTDAQFLEAGFSHLLTTTPEIHVGQGWNQTGLDNKPVGPAPGSNWDMVPGYIHALKGVELDFGPGGWKVWLEETIQKVLKDGLKWRPKAYIYGVKLPIQVRKEPKVYLLQRKGWRS
ncbi:Alg9-like mannosyltransferase family-domain-containing protein [Chytriomyces sp. MP71]|nr:Alg9-like mannosyltransferase family-domain-containing protein [Chytriomyces sp. MP71]